MKTKEELDQIIDSFLLSSHRTSLIKILLSEISERDTALGEIKHAAKVIDRKNDNFVSEKKDIQFKLSAMEKRNAELELEIERLKKVLIQRDEEAHRLSVEGMSKAVEVRNLKIKLAEFENTAPNNGHCTRSRVTTLKRLYLIEFWNDFKRLTYEDR